MTKLNFENKKIWLNFLLFIKKKDINKELKSELNNVFLKEINSNKIIIICKNKYSLLVFRKFFLNDFILFLKNNLKKSKQIINRKFSFEIKKKSKNFILFTEKLIFNSFSILDKYDKSCNIKNFYFENKNQKEILFNFINPNYQIYNLLILGKNGTGKSYLAFSINNFINKNIKENINSYLSCSSFFNLVYEIFKKKKYVLLKEIETQLLNIPILIIDDFEFIIEKKQTLLFLLTILKTRIFKKKKNIIFVNSTKNSFKKTDLYQFCSLIIRLNTYNKKMCGQIIKNFILEKRFNDKLNIIFSKKIIKFILKLEINNIYELINVYKTFIFLLNKTNNDDNESISEFNQKKYLTFIIEKKKEKNNYFEIEAIIKKICKSKKYNYQDLFNNSKTKKQNKIKRFITFYLREKINLTFKEISFFLKRDYSTIIRNFYYIKNHPEQLKILSNEADEFIKLPTNSKKS